MAEVVSTTVRKIRWIERVTFDQRLTALAVRVACAIAWHLNRERGEARVGHVTLAEKLGVVPRSIDRAVNELAAHGYITIDRGEPIGRRKDGSAVYGGRGSASVISMVLEAIEAPGIRATPESHIAASESGERATAESHLRGGESATLASVKSDSGAPKERQQSRTNPYIDPYITRKGQRPPSGERRSFSDRGRYLRELGELVAAGGRGFAFLIDHPDEDRINALCRKLRNGALTEREVRALQEEACEGVGRLDAAANGRRP